jgi:hypothetical protein
MVEVEGIPTKT